MIAKEFATALMLESAVTGGDTCSSGAPHSGTGRRQSKMDDCDQLDRRQSGRCLPGQGKRSALEAQKLSTMPRAVAQPAIVNYVAPKINGISNAEASISVATTNIDIAAHNSSVPSLRVHARAMSFWPVGAASLTGASPLFDPGLLGLEREHQLLKMPQRD